jgi:hypothetical protein
MMACCPIIKIETLAAPWEEAHQNHYQPLNAKNNQKKTLIEMDV